MHRDNPAPWRINAPITTRRHRSLTWRPEVIRLPVVGDKVKRQHVSVWPRWEQSDWLNTYLTWDTWEIKKATHSPTNRLTCQRLDHWPLMRSQRRDRNRFGSILYIRHRPGSAVTSLVPRQDMISQIYIMSKVSSRCTAISLFLCMPEHHGISNQQPPHRVQNST